MDPVDVLVIGGGPAGLSAATALARQLHTVLVIDSESYRNAPSKHMHNLATWDHRDPAEYRAAAKKDLLARYETIKFRKADIKSIKQVDAGFEVEDGAGNKWTGRKVILATGVVDDFPSIEGYGDCWGKAIYHCLFCHGFEDRGATSAGVLATGLCAPPHLALHFARNASQFSSFVTIYTHGNESLAAEILSQAGSSSKATITTDARPIKRVKPGQEGGIFLELEDGSSKHEAFLAHAPSTHPKGPFVEQLGLETLPASGDIKVTQPFCQTSVRGVFAAGDNMIMAGKAVPTAIANGAMAANGASMQVQTEKHGHKALF